MSNSSICPTARKTDLTIEELPPDTVVYDHKRNRMHCLNQSTSFIWRRCDGKTKIEEVAALLPEVGLPVDLDVVRRALKVLERAHLLDGDSTFHDIGIAVSKTARAEIRFCWDYSRCFACDHVCCRSNARDGKIRGSPYA